jgi:hypothetical protein
VAEKLGGGSEWAAAGQGRWRWNRTVEGDEEEAQSFGWREQRILI